MQPLRDPSEKPSNHADNWVSPLFAKTHTSKSSYVPLCLPAAPENGLFFIDSCRN